MELSATGAAALRRSLASACPVVPRERRRGMPARVSCVGRVGGCGGFADEAHLRFYDAAPRKAVEAAARDLTKLRAMGLVAGDPAKEKILSEDELKKKQKEEKAAMKALKKQQKEAKKAAMNCGDASSESSESECEEEQSMKMSCVATTSMPAVDQGMAMPMSVPQIAASNIATAPAMDFDKAAMKAMKKRENEQKKAAKKAMKMKKEEEKRMATLNSCKDEDSSCSSESSNSECEGEVVRMSRCATISAPRTPPASTVFPIIVPQIPDSVALDAQIFSGSANAMQHTATSIAVVEKPVQNRIEVCMGGKCKKAGSLAVLQEFETEVGTGCMVVGCKCLGKCGLGPNVRLHSEGSVQKNSPICIGVGLDDVGTIVAGFIGDGDVGMN
ncbi:unnamed protein product [Triticum turgidum subsp. durum]|uniref:Uncharacterized protein n=1 Tax=Triticum turgidum subsp. durum TaxID=4567 RepID=A0A9R0UT51_TRITD|nr:unnamed protein product [Triticum turgidum subsp. durum]